MKTESRLTFGGGQPAAPPPQPAAGGVKPRTAAPTSPPAAAPTPHAAPLSGLAALAHQRWFIAALAAVVLLLGLNVARQHWHKGEPAPSPAPASAFHKGGIERAHGLPRMEAASLRLAADAIETTDEPIAAIRTKHIGRWGKDREDQFDTLFVKLLDAIIPEGTDHPTKDQRARYAAALRAIADGEAGAGR